MIYAEILAGGKGTRMGNTEMPKQFLKIGNKPVLIHTVEKFLLQPRFDKIMIVSPAAWISHTRDILERYITSELLDKVHICPGGSDRNESIMSGIKYIEENFGLNKEDIIVTHDAVRPFITNRIIEDNIDMALEYGATDTVIPAYDTIIKSENKDFVDEIPFRDYMYQGQTPQSFNIEKLKELYYSLSDEEKVVLTDAAKIFVIKNEKVKMVQGEIFNMKITSQYDLEVANMLVNTNK